MNNGNGVVVTIRELPSKKPIRGYDHRKTASGDVDETVYLPFDQEYGIGFKMTDGTRRRLELFIDGTQVVNDLIVSDEAILERFLDSDRRFKFVSADHPSVGDPTSKENGRVEIRLYKEVPTVQYVPRPEPVFVKGKSWPTDRNQNDWTLCSGENDSLGTAEASTSTQCYSSSSHKTKGVSGVLRSGLISPQSNVGATVEGSRSNQTFGSSVWRGDLGAPQVFVFHLKGKTMVTPNTTIRCPYCGTHNRSDATCCSACPTVF